MKLIKILFFITGNTPNNYERQLASRYVGHQLSIQYRNITNASINPVEECDGVAGDLIPVKYADKPSVSEAIATFKAALKAEVAEDIAQVEAIADPTVAQAE